MLGLTLKRILLPVAAWLVVMIALGLLITKVVPIPGEDSVNRGLIALGDGLLEGISAFFSGVGSTPWIIAVTAVAAVVMRLTLHRWPEPLFLCAVVTAQAVVFFFTTLVIDRRRPAVRHLDESPPTSSFPSGHTSAAVALYAGLALVLAMLMRHTWAKALCWALLLVQVAVALSRLYRGMHHPSDVLASAVNGTVCILIMTRAFLTDAARRELPHRPGGADRAGAQR